MRYYYDHGLPFDPTIAYNLDIVLARIGKKKASCIVIDGVMGAGKTTMAVHIGDYLNGAYVKVADNRWVLDESKLIDLNKQMGMGGKQFAERLQMVIDNKWIPAIYDEGGDFNKRGSLTEFNRQLNRIFETYRSLKICPIISLPLASVIDADLYKKSVVRFVIHCHSRTDTYGSYSAYSLYRYLYVLKKMQTMAVPQQAYTRTFPNVRGHFLNLPPHRAQLLEDISNQGKKEILSTAVLQNRGLLSLDEMARSLNVTKQYVNQLLRKTNAKEKTTYKKTRYFDKNTLDMLSNLVKRR